MKRYTALLLGALSIVSQPLATEVYTWTDEKGVTHYSQFMPEQANAVRLNYRESKDSSNSLLATMESPHSKWLEQTREKRLEKKALEQKEKAKSLLDKEFSEYCEQLEKNLEVLQRGGQIKEINEQGEYRYLPEEERLQDLQDTQALFNKHCT